MLRRFFIGLSESDSLRSFMTHFGPARRTARRFVAGETLDEAVQVVRDLNGNGIRGLLNEVGESVTTREEATEAAEVFHHILRRIEHEGLDATVSVKPSHVGMSFGPGFCYENIAGIVEEAQALKNVVEIDIEASGDVEPTLEIYHQLLDTFGGGVRLAIQAYLHRSRADVEKIIARGGSVRLVKGAYDEPPEIALQDKEEIRQACVDLMELFFTPEARDSGAYLALGSHDPVLIEWLLQQSEAGRIERDRFEVQMLLGVRRDEQERLAQLGYTSRVYVPFGDAWYPYFMRRLAERPANVWFFVNSFFRK